MGAGGTESNGKESGNGGQWGVMFIWLFVLECLSLLH